MTENIMKLYKATFAEYVILLRQIAAIADSTLKALANKSRPDVEPLASLAMKLERAKGKIEGLEAALDLPQSDIMGIQQEIAQYPLRFHQNE